MRITAYTDGSACIGYPKLGGFGIYIKSGSNNFKIRKGYCNTKTGRMELMAVITCMRSIQNKNLELIIRSDSQYVCNTINEWIDNWHNTGYFNKANVDLLKQLYEEINKFKKRPKLIHIKGHQDVTDEHTLGNNIADSLANYRTQSSYEVDLPLSDLASFEMSDYYEQDNKLYYKKEADKLKEASDNYDWKNEILNG